MAPRDHRGTPVQRIMLATWRLRAVSVAAGPGLSGLGARTHLSLGEALGPSFSSETTTTTKYEAGPLVIVAHPAPCRRFRGLWRRRDQSL